MEAFASCRPEDARVPFTVPTDRDAIAALLATLRSFTMDDLRIVHVRNTFDLERLVVSEGCLPYLKEQARVLVEPGGQ